MYCNAPYRTGKIFASFETYHSEEDGIDEVYRDKDGNLEYYREHCGDKLLYKNQMLQYINLMTNLLTLQNSTMPMVMKVKRVR